MKFKNFLYNIKEIFRNFCRLILTCFKKHSIINRITFCLIALLIFTSITIFIVKFDNFNQVADEPVVNDYTNASEQEEDIVSINEESSIQSDFAITSDAEKTSEILISSAQSSEINSIEVSEKAEITSQNNIVRDEDAYLNDAVFIGDSITEGLKFYLGELNTTILSAKSLNPDTIYTAQVNCPDGEKRTILEGLKTITFSKVYILIGTNGIAFMDKGYMISQLSKFIDQIKQINSDCVIYLQSMTPVTNKKAESDNRFNVEEIRKYNSMLEQLAKDKSIYFLNIYSNFAKEDGYLADDQSPDGIHFYKQGYKSWYEFILTHTDRVIKFN